MAKCRNCGKISKVISKTIGFCSDCIRAYFKSLWPEIKRVHEKSRRSFGLPVKVPKEKKGIPCHLCIRECRIPEGKTGYCGLRRVENKRIRGGRPHEGNLAYYYDPLPTNCVGNFVCPGGTGSGYPKYAVRNGPEFGFHNLAVFYQACSFNCLYCQNYHFKTQTFSDHKTPSRELADAVLENTTCICYFGGDPTPQVLHAIKASKLALKKTEHRILRICWETNGAVQQPYLNEMLGLSLESGGCIKFDLKAWNEGIHYALCGVTNEKTLENFNMIAEYMDKRPEPPLLVASTLLVPGYVDEIEVAEIAKFICRLNPDIPYSLLAFHPHFYLSDLPTTSRSHAMRCQAAAEDAGLKRVRIGNVHLLGEDY